MSLKILVNNEEVVCKNNIKIDEKMLSTSSVILNNCYPKSWENDKDYVSKFYFPKDYSKCKITDDIYHPEVIGTRAAGTNLTINYNDNLKYDIEKFYGNTTQNGTPSPDSPVPINNVTGLQKVNVCGKNLFNINNITENKFINTSGTILDNNSWNIGEMISVMPNTNYTLSREETTGEIQLGLAEYSSNGTFIKQTQQWQNNTNKKTFTTSENTYYVIPMYVKTFSMTNIQFEKGNDRTTFEAYNGNTYEVNLGKNLYNATKSSSTLYNITYSADTSKVYFDGTSNADNKIELGSMILPSGTYTLNLQRISANRQMTFYIYEVGTWTNVAGPIRINESTLDKNYITFTLNSSKVINLALYVGNGQQYTSCEVEYQITKGSNSDYNFAPYFTPIELNKIGTYQDRIYKDNGKWYVEKQIGKVVLDGSESGWNFQARQNNVYRGYITIPNGSTSTGREIAISNYFYAKGGTDETVGNTFINSSQVFLYTDISTISAFKTWLSTHNTEVYYVLATPTYTEITNVELIQALESISLLKGINNISITSQDLDGILEIYYNYKEAYIGEGLIFCGLVKNTGKISLNPRDPHYVDLQVLDFKTLLSEGETLTYVITGKTIVEAIEQIISTISDYGFVLGNINIQNPNSIINAYSTLNKTPYDVFQYIADITQSRWTTRVIDENTIAIDFIDPSLETKKSPIQYTQTYFENNNIVDMSFNYSTNDYRNKQIMTSDEVYGNVIQTNTIIADGYTKSFMCENKIGEITEITINGNPVTFATKSEEELGVSADIIYQPGEMTITSSNTISAGSIIVVSYYPIVKGREIVINSSEISRIEQQINRKGTISRYENRNDTTSSQELIKIGQSYIKYKGSAEISLKIVSKQDLFNKGDVVDFEAPLEELSTEYMVKDKTINIYPTANEIFYTFELSSNYNSEDAINYFDNQRAKNQGNIGEGETITRNIDLESTALIKFYETSVEEIEVINPTSLDFALDGVLV